MALALRAGSVHRRLNLQLEQRCGLVGFARRWTIQARRADMGQALRGAGGWARRRVPALSPLARTLARNGAALLAVALTSCSLGPEFVPPEPPPVDRYLPSGGPGDTAGLRVLQAADIPGRWWELFRSRALNDLIEQGIQHNADLQAAEAAVRLAQLNALAQRGRYSRRRRRT